MVLVASERLEDGDDWRLLEPGELIHVGPDLDVTSTIAVARPPVELRVPDEPDPNFDAD